MIPQLKCFNHPEEDIIMVNLAKEVNMQHRTLCPICMEKIQLGQLCTIQNIPLTAQKFAKTELEWLVGQYTPHIERISNIKKLVATLRDKSDKMFQEIMQPIDDLSSSFNIVLKREQTFYNDAIQDITRCKLEDLGDILSGYKIREARKNKPDLKLIEQGNKVSLQFKSFINELKVTEDQIQNILKNQQLYIGANVSGAQPKKETLIQQQQDQEQKVSQKEIFKPITYQLTDDKVKQQEYCFAVAFNKEGSIMVAGCNENIKVWRLENGKLKEDGWFKKYVKVLEGHSRNVYCLGFSKKTNWFASGSKDYSIRCWKDPGNNEWQSSQPQQVHTNTVYCILLNQNEDQLISCSFDKSIKVWRVDQQNNLITYEYSLDKHTSHVCCISLNESETILVSCSADKQIIIWGRGENNKWEYKYPITKSADDYGRRICFINNNMIAWQQYSQGFTHIFQLENDKFIEKPELKIQLNQVGSDGWYLFPSIFNKQTQVLIQKHNKFVYIIRLSPDGKQFKIESAPIDCNDDYNFGGLTADGQYLVIWNLSTKQFIVYRLKYE